MKVGPMQSGKPSLARRFAFAWKLYASAAFVFATDMLTKAWVLKVIEPNTYNPPWKEIVPGFFYLVHIGNKGAAFGAFQGYSWLLAILALFALIAIYFFRRDLELERNGPQIIFGLIIGGILGNFVDRVVHGHVIDFIDIHLPFPFPGIGTRFPAFNVADSGITTGVFLYFIYTFFIAPRRNREADPIVTIPPEKR
jgi:signal peptidase II